MGPDVACMQAKEGMLEENSQAWRSLSAADQARRRQAAQDTAAKLESPYYYVSRTRLSIRNLPHTVDETQLKLLIWQAVRRHAPQARFHIKQVC